MNRAFAIAAAAVALLASASVLAVHWATSPRRPAGAPDAERAPAVVAEPERAAAEPAVAVAVADAPAPAPRPPPPPPVAPPAPVSAAATPIEPPDVTARAAPVRAPPAGEPWTSVPLRPREMRALWIEIRNRRPELARCWETSAPGQGATPAALMLELETSGEGLRVVDAPVERQGALGASAVACAQAQLRGLVLDVRAPADAGARMRMRYVLQ
jgi:hypothetical protein